MLTGLLTMLLNITLVAPFFILFRKKEATNYFSTLALLVIFILMNYFLLTFSWYYPSFDFVKGDWNWSGKIYAATGSIIFFLLIKNRLKEHNYLKAVQAPDSLKKTLPIAGLLLCLSLILSIFLLPSSDWDSESVKYHTVLSGLDEEIAFRGIMLGLLSTILISEIRIGRVNVGNPSIWATAILFGLVHGLSLSAEYVLSFEALPFIYTLLGGYIWGWITVKSKSILIPFLTHNLANFSSTLITMLK